MAPREYDIAVIGGGINGAGIARDAALRGLKVILLEQGDFGSGTSSWSSRLIHGGLRYLEYAEIPLVFESLRERRLLLDLAPHLVTRLDLTIPVFRESRRGKTIIRLGLLAYDLLALGTGMPFHRMLDRDELIEEVPLIRQQDLLGGARYTDAQVTYAERLVIENIIAAREAGADVCNYSPVIGINVRQGRVNGLHYEDLATGEELEIGASVIVNAAGPWVDRVLATVNRELPNLMGGTKGSHIVVGRFRGAPGSAFYVEARADGRPFFIIPWNQQYLIGTTDIRYDGDPGDVTASDQEIDYLLAETNRVFPDAALAREDIHFAYAGVRPLPRREHGPESAITRKHIVHCHSGRTKGLLSIIGGKLTTYRSLAEEAVDKALREAGLDADRCQTRKRPLPGGAGIDRAKQSLSRAGRLSAACVSRLLSIYGGRATLVTQAIDEDSGGPEYVDDSETILAAEVVHAIRAENAKTLTDIVHRRLMIGLSPDLGRSVAESIARVAANEAGWDAPETARQLAGLDDYNARLRPFDAAGG